MLWDSKNSLPLILHKEQKYKTKCHEQGRRQGGLDFFLSRGGSTVSQHPLGPENPLKSIDFTDPGRGLAPITPHTLTTPLAMSRAA